MEKLLAKKNAFSWWKRHFKIEYGRYFNKITALIIENNTFFNNSPVLCETTRHS